MSVTENKIWHLQREKTLEAERIGLPPIYNASSIYFESHEQYLGDQSERLGYGREGNPTQYALKKYLVERDDAAGCLLFSSGLMAITSTLLALSSVGTRILVANNVYGPSIDFLKSMGEKNNVFLKFFDPSNLAELDEYAKQGFDILYMEPVGSMSLEVVNLKAIADVCLANNIRSVIDATWSSLVSIKPLDVGFDVAIYSCTKFLSGCSDVFLGVVLANSQVYKDLAEYGELMGNHVSSQDVYYVLRGIKTLNLRYEHQSVSAERLALKLSNYITQSTAVSGNVCYPKNSDNLSSDNGYLRPDFGGSLITFTINTKQNLDFDGFFNELSQIRCGYSWGGAESLILYTVNKNVLRDDDEVTFRLHVGLECIEMLYKELLNALSALIGE